MLQSLLLGAMTVCTPGLLLLLLVWLARRQQLLAEPPRAPRYRAHLVGVMLVVAAFAATMSLAQARDDGRYAQSPNREWFRELTNQYGLMCCEGADGMRLDDPDWEFDGHGYRVRLEGQWMPVPPQAIVRQQNKMSYAMVWPWKEEGEWRIRCFMAGAGT